MDSSKNFQEEGNINTARCPLCREPNHCAIAADPNSAECWCDGVVFPEELLVHIPEKAVRKSCVCKECLDKYQESLKT